MEVFIHFKDLSNSSLSLMFHAERHFLEISVPISPPISAFLSHSDLGKNFSMGQIV